MTSLIAFTKKEIMAQLRSGKLLIMSMLFVLFGIMNPAIAKLTPWLMETLADTLAQSGMTVTAVTVTALDSWVQFFKNIPIALIAFVLLHSSIFTAEYQEGTLVLSLTKGLQRYKVVLSKAAVLAAFWSTGYWLCFGITYGYNAYFWDNSVAQSLPFSAICWWLFGLWCVGLIILFSTLSTANTGVLLGIGGVVLVSYMLGLLPKLNTYLPTMLTDGNALIYGMEDPKAYTASLIITAIVTILCFTVSIPIFNKKNL